MAGEAGIVRAMTVAPKRRSMQACAAMVLAVALLGACAERQHLVRVSPVAMQEQSRVCIIENPAVKFDFLGLYRGSLQDAGFSPEVVPPGSPLGACPVTTKFVAYWRWDFVMYLQSVRLDVYRDGRPAGSAAFQARSSSVDAAAAVRDLTRQLFTK